jgi:response regulator RpfG family c-di-GMP phosphodiesterase
MARILVVDDEPGMRDTLCRILRKADHDPVAAGTGAEALGILASEQFDVILTDIMMPDIDGVELLREIRKITPRCQVVMMTGQPTLESASESVRLQAFDYLEKPIDRDRLLSVLASAIRVKRLEDENLSYREHLEDLVTQRTSELEDSLSRIRDVLMATAQSLASAMELRDPYTAGHQRRVTRISCSIGEVLGLSPDRLEGLRVAGLLHDIGKLAIPAEILVKPARLTTHEMALVKTHSARGRELLVSVAFPWPVATMVGQHHERQDGSGYPDGLKGDEILLESRILAVADVLEAMSTDRPYRPALPISESIAELQRFRGTKYDASVVDACLELLGNGMLELGRPA